MSTQLDLADMTPDETFVVGFEEEFDNRTFGAVESVNGKTGNVELDAKDVGAATEKDVSDAVSQEASERQSADNNLQRQIDAVVASSDVKDVVGTKAQLDAYDTTTLGDNDIVKVLQDESENDATTYYRWNAATSKFVLIGEEGPYYPKAEINELLDAKQNKLVAGKNITIDGNEISADGGGATVVSATSSSTDVLDVQSLLDDNPNAKFFSIVATDAHRPKWGTQTGVLPLLNKNMEMMIIRFSNDYLLVIDVAQYSLEFYRATSGFLTFSKKILNGNNVVDNLTTTSFTDYRPMTLSAKQGKILNEKITALEQRIATLEGN